MKERIKIYLYDGKNFKKTYDSIAEAALDNEVSVTTAQKSSKSGKQTKNGLLFSRHKLSEEEIIALKEKNTEEKQEISLAIKDAIDYDIGNDKNVCYIPRRREEKIKVLSIYIGKHMRKVWDKMPTQVAKLHRTYIKELINSLQ